MTKYIIIIAVLAIIILSSVLLLKSMSPKSQISPSPKAKLQQGILSVSPANNSKDIGIFAEITVKFTKPVSTSDQNKVRLETKPTANGTTTWSTDGTILTLIPQPSLKVSQKYTIKLTYPNGVYDWSFETASKEVTSTEDQIKAQEAADRNYAQWANEVDTNFPWLNKLPIQKESYFVSFDTNQKKFYADLYPKKNSNILIDKQVEEFKKEVEDGLKSLEIPYTQYTIEYTVNPK